MPACELLNRQSFEYYERQRDQGLNVQIDEITLDELLSLQEPDMPAKIFSEDELKKNRKRLGLVGGLSYQDILTYFKSDKSAGQMREIREQLTGHQES